MYYMKFNVYVKKTRIQHFNVYCRTFSNTSQSLDHRNQERHIYKLSITPEVYSTGFRVT